MDNLTSRGSFITLPNGDRSGLDEFGNERYYPTTSIPPSRLPPISLTQLLYIPRTQRTTHSRVITSHYSSCSSFPLHIAFTALFPTRGRHCEFIFHCKIDGREADETVLTRTKQAEVTNGVIKMCLVHQRVERGYPRILVTRIVVEGYYIRWGW